MEEHNLQKIKNSNTLNSINLLSGFHSNTNKVGSIEENALGFQALLTKVINKDQHVPNFRSVNSSSFRNNLLNIASNHEPKIDFKQLNQNVILPNDLKKLNENIDEKAHTGAMSPKLDLVLLDLIQKMYQASLKHDKINTKNNEFETQNLQKTQNNIEIEDLFISIPKNTLKTQAKVQLQNQQAINARNCSDSVRDHDNELTMLSGASGEEGDNNSSMLNNLDNTDYEVPHEHYHITHDYDGDGKIIRDGNVYRFEVNSIPKEMHADCKTLSFYVKHKYFGPIEVIFTINKKVNTDIVMNSEVALSAFQNAHTKIEQILNNTGIISNKINLRLKHDSNQDRDNKHLISRYTSKTSDSLDFSGMLNFVV